ncbi:MAG: hypothetical protein ABII82_02865 [Verrucomicrobiota bacterium]
MELNLQPLATICCVSGESFNEGDRVASLLVRPATSDEVVRFDMLESRQGDFQTPGPAICRWVHVFKPRSVNDNPERELKLTAESLFLTLAAPDAEVSEENGRLLQVLALMLERKRVLRPKGPDADGRRMVYEHAKSKELYEIPAVELSPEFFLSIQDQLAALVGGGKPKAETATTESSTRTGEGDNTPEAETVEDKPISG